MPSKKRKYNARFPAGRIKKIMQTDEEVGKVAQAVPIIISRTLELFVESLLMKAMQVTSSRNAKTLSPSHVKQCILAEARFDFLKDLVKSIPDVSAAEEKEMMSAENSPNSSRFAEMCIPQRRFGREDSNSSSSEQTEPKRQELESAYKFPPSASSNEVMDLTVKQELKPNFYKELNYTEESTRGVITVNPTYTEPSTSTQMQLPTQLNSTKPKLDLYKKPFTEDSLKSLSSPSTPMTPITPMINIDFTKVVPEIKVLDTNIDKVKERKVTVSRQNSRQKIEPRIEIRPSQPIDLDHLNSANLEIDEDYDT